MIDTTHQLESPCRLNLKFSVAGADELISVALDPYEANDVLVTHQDQPDGGWQVLAIWLAAKAGVPADVIARNQLAEFSELVVSIVENARAERKKKLAWIASSPPHTPVSPATTASGQNGSAPPGSTISPGAEQHLADTISR